MSLAPSSAVIAATPTPTLPASPSAIGNATVVWIAVSPIYGQTGLVLAAAQDVHCSQACLHLWVSRDGGASWRRSSATGWGRGRFSIAATSTGRDVVFGEAPTGLQRSDDAGDTWRTVAPPGTPATSPAFAGDGIVAVASASPATDYILRGNATAAVAGSGGQSLDLAFMLSPSYPSAGAYPPVLLSAADRRSQAPIIEQCDSTFTCHRATVLTDPGPFAIPVMLYASQRYTTDGTVFAKAGRQVYKSTNAGFTFTPLTIMPGGGGSATAYPMLALAPGYAEAGPVRTVYVAAVQAVIDSSTPAKSYSTGGIYRSVDGGTTWSRLGSPSPLDAGASAIAVAPDGRLFASYLPGPSEFAGLVCSVDGGRHWAATCPAIGTEASRDADAAGSATTKPGTRCVPCGAGGGGAQQPGPARPRRGPTPKHPTALTPLRTQVAASPLLRLLASAVVASLFAAITATLGLRRRFTRRHPAFERSQSSHPR